MRNLKRRLTSAEIKLISYLIVDTPEGAAVIDSLERLFVEEMDDGGDGQPPSDCRRRGPYALR